MTLEIIRSDILDGVTHGFFTRKGGASTGLYEGLNGGRGSRDLENAVSLNMARVSDALGVANDKLYGMHQVHSADAVCAQGEASVLPDADGIVTNIAGAALYVLTADCQPVLFADRTAGVIGAAHAGWRGAKDGVLENTVDLMIGQGARRENITAAIGPCISQEAYEVDATFKDGFVRRDSAYASYFIDGARAGHFQFDLPAFGLDQLAKIGITAHWTGHCTYKDASRFYSYRRATHAQESDYGRLISAIAL